MAKNIRKKVRTKANKSVWQIVVKVLVTILLLALGLVLYESSYYMSVSEDLKGIIQGISMIILLIPVVQIFAFIQYILNPNSAEEDAKEVEENEVEEDGANKKTKKRSLAGTFFKLAGLVVATKVMKGLFSKD